MELLIMALLFVALNYYSWYRPLYVQTDENCTPQQKARRERQRQLIISMLAISSGDLDRDLSRTKAGRVEAERRDRKRRNMNAVVPWQLASESELETLEPEVLQRLLDSRNVAADEIIQLLVELDDPIIRPSEIEGVDEGRSQRDEIKHRILELRLRPLRELRAQQSRRLQTIGNYKKLPVRELPEG